jgi:hypothetical protein
MHRMGVKSQRRPRPGFRRFFLQQTPKERSVGSLISASKSSAKARTPIGTPSAGKTATSKVRRSCAGETGISCSEALEDEGMLKVPAYNSKKEAFHHANSKCGLGLRIAPHNRVSGTGNKPLCKNCKKLNDQDAVAGLVIRSA